jgi:hypothetical protein
MTQKAILPVFYEPKKEGYVQFLASMLINSIDYCAEGVADFFGVTSPRYEMYIEDSIKYQQETTTISDLKMEMQIKH